MKSIHTPALGVALACLASLPGAASAQSKVELFGVVDVGVAHLGGSGPPRPAFPQAAPTSAAWAFAAPRIWAAA
jgi:hypothetical protein